MTTGQTRRTTALAIVALSLWAGTVAFAQKSSGPVESRLEARRVVMADGRESFVDATHAKPGEVIEYVATYRNTGKESIAGLQATVPIPAQTEFVPGTARPAKARASLDGRSFADLPLKRSVERNGRRIEELVPVREYRHLRWFAGDLGGGKSVAFTVRVKVIDDPVPRGTVSPGSGK